jgi:hypothetical protein
MAYPGSDQMQTRSVTMSRISYAEQPLYLYRLTANNPWPFKDDNEQRIYERQISVALSATHTAVVVALFSEKGSIILDILATKQLWAAATTAIECGIRYEIIPLPIRESLRTILLFALGHLATEWSPEVASTTKGLFDAVANSFKAWKKSQAIKPSAEEVRDQWAEDRKKVKKEAEKKRNVSSQSSQKKKKQKQEQKEKIQELSTSSSLQAPSSRSRSNGAASSSARVKKENEPKCI